MGRKKSNKKLWGCVLILNFKTSQRNYIIAIYLHGPDALHFKETVVCYLLTYLLVLIEQGLSKDNKGLLLCSFFSLSPPLHYPT